MRGESNGDEEKREILGSRSAELQTESKYVI